MTVMTPGAMRTMMDVVIVGGSGMIGRRILSKLRADGHSVWVSSRKDGRPDGLPDDAGVVQWDTRSLPPWDRHFDAVVNVGGESLIGQYWTKSVKEEIWRSRVDVNRHLAAWVREQDDPPGVFVTASAVGYYGPHPEGPVTEEATPGDDFLARLCRGWEESAFEAQSDRTRVVATRFGIMLDPEEGALAMMRPLWKSFLGGTVGNGRQPFPWVSSEDAARAVVRAIEDERLSGPYNVVAPEAVTNKEFTKALGHAVHRPAPWYVPIAALRLVYGDGADILEHGQQAVPKRLQDQGFDWHDPRLQSTLDRLVAGG